jgi:hypothetical protein
MRLSRSLPVVLAFVLSSASAHAADRYFIRALPAHALLCLEQPNGGDAGTVIEQLTHAPGASGALVARIEAGRALLCTPAPAGASADGMTVLQLSEGPALFALCALVPGERPEACGRTFAGVRGQSPSATMWSLPLIRTGDGTVGDVDEQAAARLAAGEHEVFFHDRSRGTEIVQFGLLLVSALEANEVVGVEERMSELSRRPEVQAPNETAPTSDAPTP